MAEKEYIERGAVYVDKQKVKKKLQYIFKTYGVSDVLRNKINKALDVSAADMVEVRHGEWSMDYDTGSYVLSCSLCGEHYWIEREDDHKPNYCPNCGAKMDGGEN